MEDFLQNVAVHVALALEAISILVIAIGGVDAISRLIGPLWRRQTTHGVRRAAWLS